MAGDLHPGVAGPDADPQPTADEDGEDRPH
jgi:hypothetical protein